MYKRIFIYYFFTVTLLFNYSVFGQENFPKINLVTENFPPFNIIDEEKHTITGIVTKVVTSLFKKAQIEYSLESYPWARAYNIALKDKNIGLFSTSRTPERESFFQWVGPLSKTNEWALFALEDSEIKILNLEDAKKYSVGSYNEDVITKYLIKNGFEAGKNLEISGNGILNLNKLKGKRIDLWAAGDLYAKYLAQKEGIKIKKILTFKPAGESYLAISKQTSPAVVKKLNKTLVELNQDKNFMRKIYAQYLGSEMQ